MLFLKTIPNDLTLPLSLEYLVFLVNIMEAKMHSKCSVRKILKRRSINKMHHFELANSSRKKIFVTNITFLKIQKYKKLV